MGRKNQKGTVSIINDTNRIRLRWRYLSKRYSLNLFAFTTSNLLQAKRIAIQIETDMVNSHFDFTLERYRVMPLELRQQQQEHESTTTNGDKIVQLFERWTRDYRNMDCEKNFDYYSVRNMLKRWTITKCEDVLTKLNNEKFSNKTYNSRLNMLKNFFSWLVKQKIISENFLEDVRKKRIKRKENLSRKPFTYEEIRKILEAVKTDAFCPKCSRFKHSHYYPFLYFIFKTGVRNAEAIGLRVNHILIKKGIIKISEVLARTLKGTNASARIRKETKNGKQRDLPLTEDLKEILLPLVENKMPDDLVFVSPYGKCIDDKMFQRRVFRVILSKLGIKHRVLYACRHTFNSRCIEEGINPITTAFLMGNNPETALKSYTHLLSLPETLPEL
jgi:integrase